MNHVIIGAGPAGVVAAETLHKRDPSARIAIIGDEPEPPYSRMAIPYLLMENINESGTYLRKQEGHFRGRGIDVMVDTVESVDPAGKTVSLSSGGRRGYDRLLVASGSRPITPPIPGIDHARVTSCWTLADARKISGTIRPGSSVVLIGAGFHRLYHSGSAGFIRREADGDRDGEPDGAPNAGSDLRHAAAKMVRR